MDSSPDRWGRTLMDRREAILARKEKRKARKLFEEDYLLGVYDAYRMGGLRFKGSGKVFSPVGQSSKKNHRAYKRNGEGMGRSSE